MGVGDLLLQFRCERKVQITLSLPSNLNLFALGGMLSLEILL